MGLLSGRSPIPQPALLVTATTFTEHLLYIIIGVLHAFHPYKNLVRWVLLQLTGEETEAQKLSNFFKAT